MKLLLHDVTLIWIKSFTNEHDLVIATLQKQTKKGKWLMKTDWCSFTVKWQRYMFAAVGIQVSVSENLFQAMLMRLEKWFKNIIVAC